MVNYRIDSKKQQSGTPVRKRVATKSEPLEVFCRVRPVGDPSESIVDASDKLLIVNPPNGNRGRAAKKFEFSRVFKEESKQEEVFKNLALPMLQDLVDKQNVLLFAYGATSSGKTYTMQGNPNDCGLIPRSLCALFQSLEKQKLLCKPSTFKEDKNIYKLRDTADILKRSNYFRDTDVGSPFPRRKKLNSVQQQWRNWVPPQLSRPLTIDTDYNYAVFISYIEIYNNMVYDLLDESGERKNLNIYNDRINFVKDVTEKEVSDAKVAMDYFLQGNERRIVGATDLNEGSSRSHTIFNIRLVRAALDQNGVELLSQYPVTFNQFSLVDLAGSERASRTGARGDRLNEAGNINNSLGVLRQCMEILRRNQSAGAQALNTNALFRTDKLVRLFQSYFLGDGKVRMLICINPQANDYEETLNVLEFGVQSQEITTNVRNDTPLFQPRPFLQNRMLVPIIDNWPPLPEHFFLNNDDLSNPNVITEWISGIEKSKKRFETCVVANRENLLKFRVALEKTERELLKLRVENEQLRQDLDQRQLTCRYLEGENTRLQTELQQVNWDSSDKLRLQEDINCRLQKDLRDLKENMEKSIEKERVRLKQFYIEKWQNEMRKINADINKLNQDKKLSDDKAANYENIMGIFRAYLDDGRVGFMSPPPAPRVRAEPDVVPVLNRNNEARTIPKSANLNQEFDAEAAAVYATQHNTAATTSEDAVGGGVPVVNTRYNHGIVTGKVKWLDHRPAGSVETGGVLNPHIKNAKSVTNLKTKDLIDAKRAKVSNYALTHQEADIEGKTETMVFKANVIRSVTGGAQVIIDDVEKVTHNTPLADKATPKSPRKLPDAAYKIFRGVTSTPPAASSGGQPAGTASGSKRSGMSSTPQTATPLNKRRRKYEI